MTALEPQRSNYNAVSQLVRRIQPLIEGHLARAEALSVSMG